VCQRLRQCLENVVCPEASYCKKNCFYNKITSRAEIIRLTLSESLSIPPPLVISLIFTPVFFNKIFNTFKNFIKAENIFR
jgi:hypothetical protein